MSWPALPTTSNKFKQTYVQGFVDISGGSLILRNSDASFNGNVNVGSNVNVTGNLILRNTGLYLKAEDYNHYVKYINTWTADGRYIDGPTIFGYEGGAIGTSGAAGSANIVMQWKYTKDCFFNGNISVNKQTAPRSGYSLDVNGNAYIGSNLYTNGLTTMIGGLTATATQAINFGTNAPIMSGANIANGTIQTSALTGGASAFVDLTTAQTVGGAKTFSSAMTLSSGLTVSSGTVTLPSRSIADAALSTNIPLLNGNNTFTGMLSLLPVTGSSERNVYGPNLFRSLSISNPNNYLFINTDPTIGFWVSSQNYATWTIDPSGKFSTFGGITVSSGTITLPSRSIADAALSTNIPLLNGNNTFTGILSLSSTGPRDLFRALSLSNSNNFLFINTEPTIGCWFTSQNSVTWTIDSTGKFTTLGGITATSPQTINLGSNAPFMSGANIATGTIPANAIGFAYVDLTTPQTVGGAKTFSSAMTLSSGLTVSSGTVTLPSRSVSDAALSTNVPLLNETNTFTGRVAFSNTTPTAPTPSTSDNSTTLATTAYVKSNLSSYLTTSSAASTYATQSSLSAYAPLASPALTGTPTAPTATTGTNTTQIATTAFVQNSLSGVNLTNLVDLTSNQNIGGVKTFYGNLVLSNLVQGNEVSITNKSFSSPVLSNTSYTIINNNLTGWTTSITNNNNNNNTTPSNMYLVNGIPTTPFNSNQFVPFTTYPSGITQCVTVQLYSQFNVAYVSQNISFSSPGVYVCSFYCSAKRNIYYGGITTYGLLIASINSQTITVDDNNFTQEFTKYTINVNISSAGTYPLLFTFGNETSFQYSVYSITGVEVEVVIASTLPAQNGYIATIYGNVLIGGNLTITSTSNINFGTNAPTMSGANIGAGTIPANAVSGGFPYVDLTSAQTIGGTKTFSNPASFSMDSNLLNTINSSTLNTNLYEYSKCLFLWTSVQFTLRIGGSCPINSASTTNYKDIMFANTTGISIMKTSVSDGYSLDVSGNVIATSYNARSDRRLKDNIEPMESQWSNILSINPVSFDWKESKRADTGFIAQDIHKKYPELKPDYSEVQDPKSSVEEPVDLSGNPIYYGIDYGRMTPFLWKGLQETMQEIDSLKKENAVLKDLIHGLSERIASLENQ